MSVRDLRESAPHDQEDRATVGLLVAQLSDQRRLLEEATAGLTVEQLEWQPEPGVNTIGMLLAHIAVAECWWLGVLPHGLSPEPLVEQRFVDALGMHMDDDGLPLPAYGVHPVSLQGKTSGDYHGLLDRARKATEATVSTWTDDSLTQEQATFRDPVTRRWILYHVCEHTAAHLGQILLLKHLAQADGVIKHDE